MPYLQQSTSIMLVNSGKYQYEQITHSDSSQVPPSSAHNADNPFEQFKQEYADQSEDTLHHSNAHSPNDVAEQEISQRRFPQTKYKAVLLLLLVVTLVLIIYPTFALSTRQEIEVDQLTHKQSPTDQSSPGLVENRKQVVSNQDTAKSTQALQTVQKMETKDRPEVQPASVPAADPRQELSQKLKFFTHAQLMDPSIQKQLGEILKGTFYDAHYFVDHDENCQHQSPIILYEASPSISESRPLLQISKTSQQLERIIEKMKFNQDRPKVFPKITAVKRVSAQSIDTAYFFAALNKESNNEDYLQSQYYRYDKLYRIGEFGTQLPLCISLVGKNTKKYLERLYSSIERQNYTNYRIVHVDDNSDDGTQQEIGRILDSKPKLRNKTTFLTQQIRRNQLFNRNMGIRLHCQDDAIVLDMDADDWIIGNQVFQLVNSLYQTGNLYNNTNYEIWALYFGHIVFSPECQCILPNIDGQINPNFFTEHTYRAFGKWRTTHLRTFRKQLYTKIDFEQLIDKETGKQYLFPESPDAFMHSAIFQLSGPRHLKVLDEFLYFYTTSREKNLRRDHSLDIFYSAYSSQALTPYHQLQSLADDSRKIEKYTLAETTRQNREEKTMSIRLRRAKIVSQIQQLLQRQKQKNP